MSKKETPLMRQYNQIKNKYPDTILFYRLGDFFETFGDDAVTTAKVCGITLTKRNNGAAGEMPLAGFPHHQIDSYLPKMVRAGYRVAVCDQLEDPKQARGIVKRGVTEVVTPGVALYDKLLDNKTNNYVASVYIHTEKSGFKIAGVAACDVSTGEFFTSQINVNNIVETLENLAPAEVIINKRQKEEVADLLEKLSLDVSYTRLEEWIFDSDFADEILLRHFQTQSLKGYGIEKLDIAKISAGAVLHYISETQKGQLPHIKNLSLYNPGEFMSLDYATRRNLEITYSINEDNKNGTLIAILDKTVTSQGGRLFKKWITRPLRDLDKIKNRLNAVTWFYNQQEERELIRKIFTGIGDLERLISKISTGRANPRDCVSLKNSLNKIPEMKRVLVDTESESIKRLTEQLDDLKALVETINETLLDEPSAQLGGGNVFREGFNETLDGYVEAKFSGKNWITSYQNKQKEDTKIPSLKVGFNNVFGYYIDVTKVHTSKVPDFYERKQTLTNSERYTTPELKEIEAKIFSAEEKIDELEAKLFNDLKLKIASYTEIIQKNAHIIATVDCLQSFAQSAVEYDYCEPEIDESDVLDVKDGRHPVVEKLIPPGSSFTPNDTYLDTHSEQIHIITGPNMSGKSCYLRQVALVVLLGQIGSYVPAKSAKFGVVDRIFTRVGAQDNITAGESTFLVEMQEAANILNNATEKSLILLDEVGRGTATFDGISIAWAIAEYIHNNINAKTLFATHYHELNELAERYSRIINYEVEVVEAGNTIIFSHKVKKGASDHSFGIHVARMAGLPYDVVQRANEILNGLEGTKTQPDLNTIETHDDSEDGQLAIFEFRDDKLRDKILKLNVNNLTPVQALQLLSDMHKEAKKKR